MFNDTITGDTS